MLDHVNSRLTIYMTVVGRASHPGLLLVPFISDVPVGVGQRLQEDVAQGAGEKGGGVTVRPLEEEEDTQVRLNGFNKSGLKLLNSSANNGQIVY